MNENHRPKILETDLVTVWKRHGLDLTPMAVVVAHKVVFVAMLHQGAAADALRNEIARFIAHECRGECAMDPVEVPNEPLKMMAAWTEMDLLRSYAIDSPSGMVDAVLATGLWPKTMTMRQYQYVTPRQRRALERLNEILDEIAERRTKNDRERK